MTADKNLKSISKTKISSLPKSAGVYRFDNIKNSILYIGKAGNIRARVKNHFFQPSYRDNFFINQVAKIGYIKTKSEIEALILESQLIKRHQPKYNVLWKDDKNYFYVAITKEDYPRVFITHQPKTKIADYKLRDKYIGPFVEGRSLKRSLDFLRKVFPYYVASKHPKSFCLWCNLKLCPGPDPDKKQYKKNIANLAAVLSGKRLSALKTLKKEMRQFAKARDYEKAGRKRDQIIMLEKIISHSRVLEPQIESQYKNTDILFHKKAAACLPGRLEAYDISNIQGQEATGSMIVFIDGKPDKSRYRKFKIKADGSPNDVAMIREILSRRLRHDEWPYPHYILVDGGRPQLNATLSIIRKTPGTKNIQIMALAKKHNELFRPAEKNPLLLKKLSPDFSNIILRARDEAHRFAIAYHKKLRRKALIRR